MTTTDEKTALALPDPRIAFFDDLAPRWDDVGQDPEQTVRQVAQWCELLDFRPGEDLLEIGCGTGQLTGWLAAQVAPGRVMAIDFSSRMLDQARRSARRSGSSGRMCAVTIWARNVMTWRSASMLSPISATRRRP